MDEETENLAFARRFRPVSEKDYIGNKDVKETLDLYLKNKKPQSILLTGNSGCGKTTLARLIAKRYSCEEGNIEGPCNECPTCLAFNEYIKTGDTGALPDVTEVDASDKSGKKEIDAMLSSMEYPAVGGEWKVYIIDEAHLLSEGAMGRILKSLEEPPEGVLLILCTTDPEKLLDTIRNRCQLRLEIEKPTTKEIMDLLQRVCISEDKNYDLAGLRMIAARSDNVVRDSLNNIERVLTTRGDATAASVSAEFKQVSDKLIFDFYNAYYEGNFMDYMSVLYRVKTKFGFKQFLSTLSTFTTRGVYIMNSIEVEGLSAEELKSYLDLFSKFTPADLSFIFSELKRMSIGDIEANLMAFIYTKKMPVEEDASMSSIPEGVISAEDERLTRNSNLQKIESAKFQEGEKSVQSAMKNISLVDAKDLFSLEKVEGKVRE